MQRFISGMTLGTALGAGLVAGVFFAFSTFVMAALARLPPAQGIAAMQSINVTVINRLFLGVFLGTGLACVILAASSLSEGVDRAARYRFAGCAIYLVGSIAVTIAFNVPRNEALACMQPENAAAIVFWNSYLTSWTNWNHVRGLASFVAMGLFILALRAEKPALGAEGSALGLAEDASMDGRRPLRIEER